MNVRSALTYLDEDMIKKIFTAIIHPKLGYATVMSSHKKKKIRKIEYKE